MVRVFVSFASCYLSDPTRYREPAAMFNCPADEMALHSSLQPKMSLTLIKSAKYFLPLNLAQCLIIFQSFLSSVNCVFSKSTNLCAFTTLLNATNEVFPTSCGQCNEEGGCCFTRGSIGQASVKTLQWLSNTLNP